MVHGIRPPFWSAEGSERARRDRALESGSNREQRVTIARVILNNPRIFILDEATSSLELASRTHRAAGPGSPAD
jgi:ABC-type uncharacterized transport system fused permease/ATPase subunit